MSQKNIDNNNNYHDDNEDNIKIINSWDDLDINPQLLRGIYAYGFEKPSPIQRKSICPILEGKDVIAQAQSGTGKTACFTISSLEIVDVNINLPQVIIMSPTRELSCQIKKVLDSIGNNIKNLHSQLLVGGTSTETDIKLIKDNTPHIIVGCPGRIHDMMRRKHIITDKIKLVVLDEADEMLSSGFKEQIYSVFQYLSNNIQIALFSATIPSSLHYLTEKFMRNPVKIIVKAEQLTLEGIKQYYVNLEDDNMKYETLKDLFSTFSVAQCIIYCNSVRRVSDLYDAMNQDGYPVSQIHSSLDKQERQKNYEDFRVGNSRVLISSNVTARGIDIQQVSTVINFDIPKCINTYLHRIGRSGRWGRKGVAINFVTRRDIRHLKDIESFYNTQISELPNDYKGN
jgi:translation initiation factor 4A